MSTSASCFNYFGGHFVFQDGHHCKNKNLSKFFKLLSITFIIVHHLLFLGGLHNIYHYALTSQFGTHWLFGTHWPLILGPIKMKLFQHICLKYEFNIEIHFWILFSKLVYPSFWINCLSVTCHISNCSQMSLFCWCHC